MPEKQKAHNWTKVQTAIATGAMLGLLSLFNAIASLDRHKVDADPPSTPVLLVTSASPLKSSGFAPTLNSNPTPVFNSNLIPASTKTVTRTRSS